MPLELGAHQLKAVKEMHNGCVLKGGVGTGKSRTALAYFYTRVVQGNLRINGVGSDSVPELPRDIVIITTAKKRDSLDWQREASDLRLGSDRENSVAGIQLTVDSWNNVVDYVDRRDIFFIFDEQRLVGSGAWVKAFIKIAKSNQWIMLSATPGDTWMDYVPVFIANGWYKNRTEFVREHVVFSNYSKFPKIDRYLGTKTLERRRSLVLVEMPYDRHTRRILEYKIVDYDQELFQKVWRDRWHVYEERPLKDVGEMFIVGRKVVNSDPSRVGELMKLMESHPKLIVFYNFDYELAALRVMADMLDVKYGEWNGHRHNDLPVGKKWLYLVQYTAGSEGWNCVETDSTVFYSLNYSYKIFEQAQGRIDRLNTPFTDLHYYVFRSSAAIDQAISKALNLKQKFNEKAYLSKKGEKFEQRAA